MNNLTTNICITLFMCSTLMPIQAMSRNSSNNNPHPIPVVLTLLMAAVGGYILYQNGHTNGYQAGQRDAQKEMAEWMELEKSGLKSHIYTGNKKPPALDE